MKQKDRAFGSPYSILILFAVIFLVYGQILTFSLGKLDECNIIIVNLDLHRDFANLKTILLTNPFFNRGGEFYRPLQNLTFMVDAHLGGPAGWGYYLTNIILHGTVCSLLWYLLVLLGSDRRIALLTALIYAVHPLFVQTVAWAPSRGDMLIAAFGLLAVVAFIRFTSSGEYKYLVLNIITYALALFSKESAILVPVACYLWLLLLAPDRKISTRAHVVAISGYLLCIILFFYLRNKVVGISVPEGGIGIAALFGHLQAIPEFIFKFVLPVHLSPMPGYWGLLTGAGILVMVLLGVVAVKGKAPQWRLFLFGFGWFLLFIGPSLVFVNKYGSQAFDYMEHRGYFPLAGLAIILALWMTARINMKGYRQLPVYMVILVVIFGIYTFRYSKNYKDGEAYFSRAVEANPSSAVAWYCRGTVLIVEKNDYRLAKPDLDRAIELYPGYAQAYLNRGYCFEQMGDVKRALSDYREASRIDPSTYEPHAALAFLFTSRGADSAAIEEYNIAIALNPSFSQGFYHRARIKMDMNDYPSALEDLSSSIRLNDGNAEAYLYRGVVRFQMGETAGAREDLDRAIMLDDSLTEAYINRGVLKFQAGDLEAALADLSRAVSLNGSSADALLNRGRIYYYIGDRENARSDWEKAARSGSRDAEILLKQI